MTTVKQASCTETRNAVKAGERWLIDVRTPGEWDVVHLPGARLLDAALLEELKALPPDTPLAFLCHHGVRSHQAASWFASHGFTDVWNVVGGIDAWAVEVDPTLERY